MRKLFVYLLICLFAYLFISPQAAVAAGEFRADYDVQYAVAPSGVTIVTQNITLTNKLSNLYPQKYSILIDSEKITNVIAYDRGGPIIPTITQRDGKTEILLVFNDKVVGLGKSMTFTLRYENQEIAQQNGAIWEINIPGVADDPDISRYTVSLSTPATFGPNAYMTPLPQSGNQWTKDQLTHGGISAAYGTLQKFSVDLSYYLENTLVTPQTEEIALPPDTAYQTVTVNSLSPKPMTVLRDGDGNWLARYQLGPNETMRVSASLGISVSLTPKENASDRIEPAKYLQPDQYWETQNPKIISLANQYRTPRQIYDYVVSALEYDYNRVNQNPIRKGALQALATPDKSLCTEFADMFVAIARAAGIPSREVVGYAYTTNSRLRPLSLVADVLHAWPEYYDANRGVWVPVDPTWAKTTGGVNYFDKLDFNHIVFAINGLSSTKPYPAGSYRQIGKRGKDVLVRFGSTPVAAPAVELTATISFPKQIVAGVTNRGTITVENASGQTVPQATISVQSAPVNVAYQTTAHLIPPYGKIEIPITLVIPSLWTFGTGKIAVTVNDSVSQTTFDIQPVYVAFLPAALVAVPMLLLAWILLARPRFLWQLFRK